jgi:putative endonuclease
LGTVLPGFLPKHCVNLPADYGSVTKSFGLASHPKQRHFAPVCILAAKAVTPKPWRRRTVDLAINFCYVYMLESLSAPGRHYVGLTDDLKSRLIHHNSGDVPSTSGDRPWRIKTAVAFTDRQRAAAFERYLKSGSGRAYAVKHF